MIERLLAVGVDGARGGWLAALAYGSSASDDVERVTLKLMSTFAGVTGVHADGACFAIDMPMGLLRTVQPRPCDEEARELLAGRASTVFAPPSRPLLEAVVLPAAQHLVDGDERAAAALASRPREG